MTINEVGSLLDCPTCGGDLEIVRLFTCPVCREMFTEE
jgi:predicted RNA-binding Zn-ribbon protein involved in translation (DUF1610 family)